MRTDLSIITWAAIIQAAVAIFPAQFDTVTTVSSTEIGWINVFDCSESSSSSQYTFNGAVDKNDMKNFFEQTIAIQVLPSGTTPKDYDFNNPQDDFAFMSKICSDPIINLNDNIEMAWPIGIATPEWVALNWYGSSVSLNRLIQDLTCGPCRYRDAMPANSMMYHACCNHGGLHLTTYGRCELDYANKITVNHGLSIWLGFTKNKDCECTSIYDCNGGYEAQEICHFLEGNPSWISGDPHTMTFAGRRHDFQGLPGNKWGQAADFNDAKDQFFYIYPCSEYDNIDLPYNVLVTQQHVNDMISGADYIVLELFEDDGNINPDYYVYLGSEFTAYASVGNRVTTYYDDTSFAKTILQSEIDNVIGNSNRFTFYYKVNSESSKPSRTAVLTVDGNCTLEIHMVAQSRYNHNLKRHQMNYIRVNPPSCYKCEICGLFGDFKSTRMQTCDGRYVEYGGYLNAWDADGWTWEKRYVDANCRIKRDRRPKQSPTPSGPYVPETPPPQIANENPCADAIRSEVIKACEDARTAQQHCCDNIGGDFCQNLQDQCEFDACVGAEGELYKINEQVQNLFIAPVTEECSKLTFEEENYVPTQCDNPKQTFITPTCDGIQSNAIYATDPRGKNVLTGNGKKNAWKMINYKNNPLKTWPLKIRLDGPIYGFIDRSECSILNISLNIKCITKSKNSPPQLQSHVCDQYYNLDSELYEECLYKKRASQNGGSNIRHDCELIFAFDVGSNKHIVLNVSNDGISIYPPCGGSLATGNPGNLIHDGVAIDNLSSALVGGDISNWNSNQWVKLPILDEIQFDFHNNLDDNEFTISFGESSSCVYKDSVDVDEDVKMFVSPDWGTNQMVLVKAFSTNGAERINVDKGQTPLKYFDDLQFEQFTERELVNFVNEIDIEVEDDFENDIGDDYQNNFEYDYNKQLDDLRSNNDKTEIMTPNLLREYEQENNHILFSNGKTEASNLNNVTGYQIFENKYVWCLTIFVSIIFVYWIVSRKCNSEKQFEKMGSDAAPLLNVNYQSTQSF